MQRNVDMWYDTMRRCTGKIHKCDRGFYMILIDCTTRSCSTTRSISRVIWRGHKASKYLDVTIAIIKRTSIYCLDILDLHKSLHGHHIALSKSATEIQGALWWKLHAPLLSNAPVFLVSDVGNSCLESDVHCFQRELLTKCHHIKQSFEIRGPRICWPKLTSKRSASANILA